MKYLALILLFGCAQRPYQLTPHRDSDLPFCMEDADCMIYRSRCAKFVAFNKKYQDYVDQEFNKREEGMRCDSRPDGRRFRTECRSNACELLQMD